VTCAAKSVRTAQNSTALLGMLLLLAQDRLPKATISGCKLPRECGNNAVGASCLRAGCRVEISLHARTTTAEAANELLYQRQHGAEQHRYG
jgi:hypothetical protein